MRQIRIKPRQWLTLNPKEVFASETVKLCGLLCQMHLANLTLSGKLQGIEVHRFVLFLYMLSALPDKLTANNPLNCYLPNDLSNEQRQLFLKLGKRRLSFWHWSLSRLVLFFNILKEFGTSLLLCDAQHALMMEVNTWLTSVIHSLRGHVIRESSWLGRM